jgi:hypothetical protein
MEPLWSPAVATGGNRWQMRRPQNGSDKAKTVAVGCDQLPEPFHGKEGVDGSSPSQGFCKRPGQGPLIAQIQLLLVQRALGMEPFMEPSARKLPPSEPRHRIAVRFVALARP